MLLLIYACRKNDNSDANPNKAQLIIEAKSFFDDEIANLPQLNDNNVRHSLNKIPLWDKAKIKKISLGEAVIVPIKYEKEILLKPEGEQLPVSLEKTSYLMIYKNKQQKLQAEWVTIIANQTAKSVKFTGIIAIENWNGKFKRGFAFGAEGDILPIYLNSAITYKKIAYGKRDYCFTIEHYGYVMDYPQVIGTETFCFSSGGGGDTGPDDYTPDCDGVVGSGAYTNSTCNTCMGGTTGITECPPKRDTTNKVTNHCINNALEKALGRDVKSKVKNLMTSTFLANTNINLTFYSLAVPSTSPHANADAYSRQSNASNPYEQLIVFNENKMPNRSEEYNVATVYHEVFHAYLSILFTKDTDGILVIPDQHENMIWNYLDMLTSDLILLYPVMEESDARALSWAGLEGTSRYGLLTDTQKSKIAEINLKYSTKPALGITNSLGTYCN